MILSVAGVAFFHYPLLGCVPRLRVVVRAGHGLLWVVRNGTVGARLKDELNHSVVDVLGQIRASCRSNNPESSMSSGQAKSLNSILPYYKQSKVCVCLQTQIV